MSIILGAQIQNCTPWVRLEVLKVLVFPSQLQQEQTHFKITDLEHVHHNLFPPKNHCLSYNRRGDDINHKVVGHEIFRMDQTTSQPP